MGGAVSREPQPPAQHVFVIGGTGRTGRRLVRRLCADPTVRVSVLARDPERARQVFGDQAVELVPGDLHAVGEWAHHLKGVSHVVTAVSCGKWTDPQVLIGLKAAPTNVPSKIDAQGIAELAAAAKEHGVSRIVAVTTASTDAPWSPAAIFLNAVHCGSVKHKWEGEQAIRASGVDYVILRPYGLGPDAPSASADQPRGVEWSQGEGVGRERRRIPREDVARLCHEAVQLAPSAVSRASFECWATDEHRKPVDWMALRPDPPGPLPAINHDLPVALALGGAAALFAGALRGSWRLSGRIVRGWLR